MHNPLPMHAGRRDMARELGVQFEALRKNAHEECLRNEGAVGVLAQAESCLEAQISHFRDKAKSGEWTAEQAQAARDRVQECAGTLRNLKMAAEHNLLAQRGKLAQAEAVLDACQAAFDQEGAAVAQVLRAAEAEAKAETPPTEAKAPRRTGERPEASLAAKRRQKAD